MIIFNYFIKVLKSGKSLHENIAMQFLNSVFCSAGRNENEDENCYVLKDRFSSKLRSKSRSKSKSKSKEKKQDSSNKDRSRSDSRNKRRKSKYEKSSSDNHSRSGI